MRKLIVMLLIVAVVSPFAAIFLGPLVTGDSTASLYFFPAFMVAIMVVPPLALAFVVAPAGKRGAAERSRTRATRQACSAALVVAALLSPWWWPAVGAFRQELANRGDLGLLRQVCKAKAEDVTMRTVSGVRDLSIRLPRGSRLRDIWKDPQVIETPLHSRDPIESTWEAPTFGVARFEQVVLEEPVASGGIELHGPAQTERAPLGHLDAGAKSPRYELTWDYIQSNSEQRAGLVGIRTLLTDTASGEVLARRTTYFLRKERVTIYDGSVNPMYEACENAIFHRNGHEIMFIDNSFDWVRRVLQP
ncbi:MAG: hypothetical protein M3N82_09520 [Pseudomonadota bacterium]|nr:hypothetical protein [Pseudomonadota bacterium]